MIQERQKQAYVNFCTAAHCASSAQVWEQLELTAVLEMRT